MLPATDKTATTPRRLRELSNNDLLFHTELAVRHETAVTISILHHLNEIERRRLFADLGYSSLFDYATRRLKYTSSAAARRIAVARCIRHFPQVLDMLHARELTMSTAALVAPILSNANANSVLERVKAKSFRAVEHVVSEYRPPLMLRDRVRPVRVPARRPEDADTALLERHVARAAGEPTPGAGSDASVGVTEQKLFVQFLASEELMAMFERVQVLVSTSPIDSSFADVLEVVLSDYLERHSPEARQRRRETRRARHASTKANPETKRTTANRSAKAATAEPRQELRPAIHSPRRECGINDLQPRNRHVPDPVRDAVFVRDGGRCTFVARNGTRCESTRALQVDHVQPYAASGSHHADNLRLLCPAHNRLAAEQTLGKHVMQRYWRRE